MNKTRILRTSLDLLYFSGASRAFAGMCGGVGAIFMLHHIRPRGGQCEAFAPNAGLEVTPEFLDGVISFAKTAGYDLVSLDEAVRRVREGELSGPPFACFTIDDGYRDNLEHAWPVFARHDCPFTIFVAPAITDGACELWWRGLEEVIAGACSLHIDMPPVRLDMECRSDAQKQAAFEALYRPVRSMPEHEQREWIRRFCAERGVDVNSICRAEAMGWDEIRKIAADPLCTIGAHTVHHYAVSKLPPEEVVQEAVQSRDRIEQEIGVRPTLFAYPYGDAGSAGPRDFELIAKAGFEAAVTTRKGLLFPAHKDHLTALPRVSLNGGYQRLRYVDVLLSGTAFALWNGLKLVKAA